MTKSRHWTVSSVVCTALIGLFGSTFFAFPEAAEAGPRYTRNQRRWMAKLCAGKDASKPSEIDPCMVSAVKARCNLMTRKASEPQPAPNVYEQATLAWEYAQSCVDQFASRPGSWKEPLKYLDVAEKEFVRMMLLADEERERTSLWAALKPVAKKFVDRHITPIAPMDVSCIESFVGGFTESPTQILHLAFDVATSLIDGVYWGTKMPLCKGLYGTNQKFCALYVYLEEKVVGIFDCIKALKAKRGMFEDLVSLLIPASIKGICSTVGQVAFDVFVNFLSAGASLPATLATWAKRIAKALEALASVSNISTHLKVTHETFKWKNLVIKFGKSTMIDAVQNSVQEMLGGVGDKCK